MNVLAKRDIILYLDIECEEDIQVHILSQFAKKNGQTDPRKMLYRIANERIALGVRFEERNNDTNWSVYILETENSVRPDILWSSKNVQRSMIGCAWLFTLIGSYFRLLFYRYLLQQYKKKELTLVNYLSLAVIGVEHLSNLSSSIGTTMVVWNNDPCLFKAVDSWLQMLMTTFSTFSLFYSYIGSLGVSIYRLILIKNNHWLRNVIRKQFVANMIFCGGTVLTTMLVMVMNSHDFAKLRYDACATGPKLPLFRLLDKYEQSRGNLPILSYYVSVRMLAGAVMLIATISKIIVYIIFFHHMYKHDNNKRLLRLLEPSVTRNRNKRNAITFFGEFASFVIEFSLIVLLLFAHALEDHTRQQFLIAVTFWRFKFAAVAAVEVVTSNVLRPLMFRIELFNIIFGLN